ncbi:MAG: HEAT repeat domain-containing protein [Elusimicrobia bacterium]|nr:HEAT repeat domain-containing protein [Elusimicrobiota bacterium]
MRTILFALAFIQAQAVMAGDLAQRLLSKDDKVRSAAWQEMNAAPPSENVKLAPALIAGLTDKDETTRGKAAETLAQAFYRTPQEAPERKAAAKALIKALADDSPSVRSSAADALGRVGIGSEAREAVPALIKLLAQPRQETHDVTIAGMKGKQTIFHDGERRGALEALRHPAAASALPQIIAVLQGKEEDPYVRSRAAFALGAFGDKPEALSALIGAVKDADPGVRGEAACQLGRFRHANAQALAAVASALQDPDAEVRGAAQRCVPSPGAVASSSAKPQAPAPAQAASTKPAAAPPAPAPTPDERKLLREKVLKDCVSEIGLFCHPFQDDARAVVSCLRSNKASLLEACAKSLEAYR